MSTTHDAEDARTTTTHGAGDARTTATTGPGPTALRPMADDLGLRDRCHGAAPLTARLEPWLEDVLARPDDLAAWLAEHGSPLNLLHPGAMEQNAEALLVAADAHDLDLGIFFARKANKGLAFVDEALRLGLGVDVASERELRQVLDRGVPAERIVLTAAVKSASLLDLAVRTRPTVALDNADELDALLLAAHDTPDPVPVALRLAPALGPDRPQTRFGLPADAWLRLVDRGGQAPGRGGGLTITGVHFHLDGYDAGERAVAIGQATELVDALRERGHRPAFVDIGGGIPMSYLDDGDEWERFWDAHRAALSGDGPPQTFGGHGLGFAVDDGRLRGRWGGYPYHQTGVRGAWLHGLLAHPVAPGGPTAADALRSRGLELRCEPGRSLLDGCGATVARVAFRKPRDDGSWLVGLEMNRTQCRTTSDDFLVDPLVVRPASADGGSPSPDPVADAAIEGHLVGAYCIERELLTWRRLRFPHGVAVGDLVVFPNTAGYLMHILESASHQIPLARNVVVGRDGVRPDPIDAAA
ncbi:Y4yA family PLP-dependent enzyme [Patulibacter minatonensis]|uniref:Y4yA family PLP-dependent enzyme n=1 Tax=Patulibacter minatonensis TaxID=298163 RepID=UPI0004BB0035|nr:Y4yA family PLP-dependent enzyme [Patulibacter minatonensis]